MKIYQLNDTAILILVTIFQKCMLERGDIDKMLAELEFTPSGVGNILAIQNPPTFVQIPNEDDEEDEDENSESLDCFKEFSVK